MTEEEQRMWQKEFSVAEPQEFERLFQLCNDEIIGFVAKRVNNSEDAKEIAAEAFLRAWKYLVQKRKVNYMRPLIYRIARNSIYEYYRNQENAVFTRDEDQMVLIADQKQDPVQTLTAIEKKEQWALIHSHAGGIKKEYWELLELRFIQELTIEEIAVATERSRVSVRVTLHRAVKALKKKIGKSGITV